MHKALWRSWCWDCQSFYFFMWGTARASRSNLSPNGATHMEHKDAHVCAHADVLYKTVHAPTQNTQTFEHRGGRLPGRGDVRTEGLWSAAEPGFFSVMWTAGSASPLGALGTGGLQRDTLRAWGTEQCLQSLCTDCAEKFLVLLLYHLQKWTQTLNRGDSFVTLLVTMAANIKNFQSSKPWRERKYFSRQSHHKPK